MIENIGVTDAIGCSLIAEAVGSAIYHVCPNSASFQFGETHQIFPVIRPCLRLSILVGDDHPRHVEAIRQSTWLPVIAIGFYLHQCYICL